MNKKNIWMYWEQGWDKAPKVVRMSKNSFFKFNPDYEIVLLDSNNINDYIDLPKGIETNYDNITIQKITDLYRLALLSKYGGIWTDATVICRRPINEWLENYYSYSFFAFRNPGKDRLMSSWFIAADKKSLILQRLNKKFSDLFADNYFSNQKKFYRRSLIKIFSLLWNDSYKTTPGWLSWFALKILRVYPYYIFHYTFNKLIINDTECSKLWYSSKPFIGNPHILRLFENDVDGIGKAKKEIDSGHNPVYKMSLHVDYENKYWKDVIAYLEEN